MRYDLTQSVVPLPTFLCQLEGRLAMARGRYEKAVKFFRKVLVSKTQVLGLSHAAVAATLGRLAECEMLRCDYQVRALPI